jgi:hypothetical protein
MLNPGTIHNDGDRLEWPRILIVAPKRYLLDADYVIDWTATGHPRQRLIVPAGFECDGASVPAILEWYLGREKILPAAVPHDWHYAFAGRIPPESHLQMAEDGSWIPANHLWTRDEADRFFARNLKFCEIRNGQRRDAYRAVRLAGWIAWRRAERKG